MIGRRNLARRLRRETRGVTAIEFAIIAPIVLMLTMGLFEICYQIYAQAVLEGATNKAARDLTLEDAKNKQDVIKARVTSMFGEISSTATITTTSNSFSSFTKVNQYEDFKDVDGDKAFDPGEECFTDVNASGVWDKRGKSGIGGADDIVAFTATATYPRLFPMGGILGWSDTARVSATTTLRNQPYGIQAEEGGVEICPKPPAA